MKAIPYICFASFVVVAGPILAQNPEDRLIEPVAAAPEPQLPEKNGKDSSLAVSIPSSGPQEEGLDQPPVVPPAPPASGSQPPASNGNGAKGNASATPFGPLEHQKQEMNIGS